ncbi:MAG: M23 family metallopeptidase [Bacteroidales bacterium]|nr:M23 family metallopeptidase [Bacteroidales bacterium]
MERKREKKSVFKKLKHKYRLAIMRDETYEEVLNLRLSKLNVFTIVGLSLIVILSIVISLIVYTPIREFIPGYPDENTRRNLVRNMQRLDTLENEILRRDAYFENIRRIVSGEEPENYDNSSDSLRKYDNISFSKSEEDSLLRQLIEQEDQFTLDIKNDDNMMSSISRIHFFPPLKGMVTNSFNTKSNHYGTDIVAPPNSIVKATLEGTVIIATWTLETGYVIQIQHENDLLSIYKHNAELLKKEGEYVNVGEPIAIMGNSGELTTGPHLHFELWYKGKSLNPENLISF